MSAPATAPIGIGDQLPPLSLYDDAGQPVVLRNLAERSSLILFFYPRDDGLRCRTQACGLRDSWPLLRSEGIEVFGVNHGDRESHARFKERYSLPYPLLVDEGLELSNAFGFVRRVPPGVSPIVRSTVIVDPGGRIRTIARNVKASSHFDMLRVNLGLPDREPEAPAPVEPHDSAEDSSETVGESASTTE